MSEIRYPDCEVKLLGENGNAFYILGVVTKALKLHGASDEDIEEYKRLAMSGDYDNLLVVTLGWVVIT